MTFHGASLHTSYLSKLHYCRIKCARYNAPINVIPDYHPHGVCRGSMGDFSVLAINCASDRVGTLAHFLMQEDSKKDTNTPAQKCSKAGALARMNY